VSLALHLILMTPVLIGLGASTQRQHIDSSEFGKPADDDIPSSSMTVSFIDAADGGSDTELQQTHDRLAAGPPLSSVAFPVPEPIYNLPSIDDADPARANLAGSSPSDPGRQLLFGRYIGQITARVERAWMRPRTPIDDAAVFACRVRITQDRSGVVKEIELVRCNGTPRWQTSLVQAIQSASPLPAPPDTDVYRSEVMLDLQSATFAPGDSPEGFEPEVSAVAMGHSAGR
jgi:hypothetical protein